MEWILTRYPASCHGDAYCVWRALPPACRVRRNKMSKWLKCAFLAVLLIAAGYFFGAICKQIGQAYALVLSPSRKLLDLLLWYLLALCAMAVTAGLVAALLRPVWVGIVAFAFSGLAVLLAWEVTTATGMLVMVYFVAAWLYFVGAVRELNERIRFSVRPITKGQGTLFMALILVACGSMHLGYAAHIEREGFSIPEHYIEMLLEQVEKQIEARVPAEQRQEIVAQLREELPRAVDDFVEHTVKPYEQYIPLAVAAGLFTPLVTITRLLAWVPNVILMVTFPLLTALRVTKVVAETREVQRLVIG